MKAPPISSRQDWHLLTVEVLGKDLPGMAEEVDHEDHAESDPEGVDELDSVSDNLGLYVEDQVPVHPDIICLIDKFVARHYSK